MPPTEPQSRNQTTKTKSNFIALFNPITAPSGARFRRYWLKDCATQDNPHLPPPFPFPDQVAHSAVKRDQIHQENGHLSPSSYR